MLLLDALYPGTPAQLVSNCKAVGAAGCLGYVWRPGGIGGWTASHFDALRAAGLVTAPIVVPAGDSSTSYATLIAAARSFGFNGGPLVCDMESPYNLPSQSWWNGAITAFRAAKFEAIKYGNSSDVGGYANADGWWKAAYIQHSVNPQPAVPQGLVGWQYADQVSINGITYDASVFLPSVFPAPPAPPSPGGPPKMIIVLGTVAAPGGQAIYEWTGSGFTQLPGGAVQVLVNNDPNPWVANDQGEIFRWNGTAWGQVSGQAYIPPPAAGSPHTHPLSGETGVGG